MLGDDNKMVFYMGLLATPIAGPKEITSVKMVCVRKFKRKQQSVLAYTGNKDKG
jgi:hypothetical protein